MRFLQAMQRIYIVVYGLLISISIQRLYNTQNNLMIFSDNYKNADDREISNVDVIQAYIKGDRGALVSDVKTGHWYKKSLMQ